MQRVFYGTVVAILYSLSVLAAGPANNAPVANAGPDLTSYMGAQIFLASQSTDADGDPLEYRWSIVSRPEGSKANLINPNSKAPSFFADRAGAFVIRLMASDGIFISNLDDVVVEVLANSAPVIVVDPYLSVRVGELTLLNASASFDLEQRELQFRWVIHQAPEGSNASLMMGETAKAELVPDKEGPYILRVWVSDSYLSSVSYVALRVYGDSCELPGNMQDRQCEGVFEVDSDEDLKEYLATYGINEDQSRPKNIKITGNLSA